MTCPNQLELGERKKEISEKTDESTKEGPHFVGVWTLKRIFVCDRLCEDNSFETEQNRK